MQLVLCVINLLNSAIVIAVHFVVQAGLAGSKGGGAQALERLRAAHDVYSRGGPRSLRLAYHIGALMAREHLVADDPASARKLLDSVAGMLIPITRFQSGD